MRRRIAAMMGSMIGTIMLTAVASGAAPESGINTPQASVTIGAITYRAPRFIQHATPQSSPRRAAASADAAAPTLDISTHSFRGSDDILPLWTFNIKGSRDGDHHIGAIVGHSPFDGSGNDHVKALLVPLIIHTHTVATGIDTSTFVMSTAAGDTNTDASAADNRCLTAPNNVPVSLVRQSPILTPTHFVLGGQDFGTTQYIDAFQRASFSQVLGNRVNDYHLLLDPIRVMDPVVIDVPVNEGLAITDPTFFAAFGFSICAPLQLVNIGWFDSFVQGTVIPKLQSQGLEPGQLPIFVSYEAAWPVADVTNILNCCAVGYHNETGVPVVTQTYAVADFDRTQFFVGPAAGLDTEVLAHEVGEWANDPLGDNLTAPWGHTGQVSGCQANLEVGDPLSGTDIPAITMPNGFTYHLQELAFFSWFFGAPSVGINGWFSDNGTFLTDAGPNCN